MSYIKINKHKVLDCCKKNIEHIKKRRNGFLEDAISEQMNKKWFKATTREEAIEKINKEISNELFAYSYHLCWGSNMEDKSKRLIKACNISDEDVWIYLDTVDCDVITWLDKDFIKKGI